MTNQEAKDHPRSAHPLFSIPGVTTQMVRGDGLHILWCKGVYAHFLGSILHHLCWYPHASRKVKPCERLATVFKLVQEEYTALQSPTRLTNLKLSMFTDPKKPHVAPPFLNSKGAESKHFLPAFLQVCKKRKLLSPDLPEEKEMLRALENMDKLVQLWDSSDMFLEQEGFEKSLELAADFLQAYGVLNEWAASNDTWLFHIVMKHHMLLHLAISSRFLPQKPYLLSSRKFCGQHCKPWALCVHGCSKHPAQSQDHAQVQSVASFPAHQRGVRSCTRALGLNSML